MTSASRAFRAKVPFRNSLPRSAKFELFPPSFEVNGYFSPQHMPTRTRSPVKVEGMIHSEGDSAEHKTKVTTVHTSRLSLGRLFDSVMAVRPLLLKLCAVQYCNTVDNDLYMFAAFAAHFYRRGAQTQLRQYCSIQHFTV